MKFKSALLLGLIILGSMTSNVRAQTTAMNFTGMDCNSNPVNLFNDLDGGNAVVLFFYMPNCGTCPPPAQKIQTMANNINASHPGLVKGFAFPFQNSTTCASVQSWVTTNNLSLFAPMDSGATQVAYYGGFGMPTVVLLGGMNRDVLFVTQNFTTSDTTVMRDLILGLMANTNELETDGLKFKISPNPSADFLTLNFTAPMNSELFVELVDLNGKLIFATSKEMTNEGENTKEINISSIENGNYFLNVHLNEKVQAQKVIISH